MKKLNVQQLRALAELSYSKKCTSVREVVAEEILTHRLIKPNKNLVKFENKYFILKEPNLTKVVKTSKWDQIITGKYKMLCEYVSFSYDNGPNILERQFFTVVNGKCSWYSDHREYLEQDYAEITEEEWLKWVEKFKMFYSAMHKLKDWE